MQPGGHPVGVRVVTDDLPDEQRELPYQGGHGQDLLVGRRARALEQVHYFDVMTSWTADSYVLQGARGQVI